jgi:hypothetical protein
MTRVCRRWTKEEDEIILDYANKGFTYKEISPIVNRTVPAINIRLRHLGFTKITDWSKEEIELLRIYTNKGLSYIEISQKINRTLSAIERQCHIHKIYVIPQWTNEEDKILIDYINLGLSSVQISILMNKTDSAIAHRTHRIGLKSKSYEKYIVNVGDKQTKGFLEVVNKITEHQLECLCCKCGKICQIDRYSFNNNKVKSCGCLVSYYESVIEKILNKYNIGYKKQKTFDKCVYKNKLRFDFYLLDFNILIEYNGIQHYPKKCKKSPTYNPKHMHSNKKLKENQIRDEIKRKFCKNNNIKLIEIPYWEKNNIEQILIKELNL